jgi:hypothetical protein
MLKIYVYDGADEPITINTNIDKNEFEKMLEDLPEFIRFNDSNTGVNFSIPMHSYPIGWQEE